MQQLLTISGKAKNVFKYMGLINRHKGNITLKKLAKENKTIKIALD